MTREHTTSTHTLKNGITVILEPRPNANAACVVVGVNIGANHEEEHEHGLAHFFEHMCFKGTKTRPDHTDLLIRMDECGLVGNAYTGREYTGYYLLGRAERIRDMADITSDIFLHSLFPEHEMEKEKGVIIEEIARSEDDPTGKAYSVAEQSLFHGTPVEHDILGTPETVRSFTRADFLSFLRKHYTAGNTVISVAGRFDGREVLEMLEDMYAPAPHGAHTGQIPVPAATPRDTHTGIIRRDVRQTHIVIGGYAPSRTDADRYAAHVFTTVLGGSMSSRLFLRVREKLGACYTIHADIDSDTNYGSLFIHTGINGGRTEEVMTAIAEECAALRNTPVSDAEIRKAREYILGLRVIRRESMAAVARNNMESFAQVRHLESTAEYEEKLKAVTPEEVMRIAAHILRPDAMTVCYVGNTDIPRECTDKFLKLLG